MTCVTERDRVRERWRLMRRQLGQSTDEGVQPLGLARRAQHISVRLVILPGDPFATDLSFDDEFWEWWTNQGSAPFGGHVQWTNTEPSTDAAAKYTHGSKGWTTYLAVHRHGGVELGSDRVSWEIQERRYFGLVNTVGLIWIGASAQAEAVGRFGLSGPWELTLVLYETEDTCLAGLGDGWQEPHESAMWLPPVQREPHVMIRRELDTFPDSENDVRDLTFDIGARIEDAWGMKHRRFLDRVGTMEGRFNPHRWRL